MNRTYKRSRLEWEAQPTAVAPYHFHDRAGSAYLFADGGSWWIEHNQGGKWTRCALLIYSADDTPAAVGEAARRHLARKPHPGVAPVLLSGSHHGGGGATPSIKAPRPAGRRVRPDSRPTIF